MALENTAGLGVQKHYGPRTTNQKFGGQVPDDLVKYAAWTFSYNDLPDAASDKLGLSIPAYAKILSAKLEILTAFTSTSTTTDLTVGLQTSGGTEIDNDGLITAAQATQTTIATRGNFIDGASGTPAALIGASIGATAGELVVTPSVADLLTGKARVIVSYIVEGV